jgi:hypothetical protein
MAGSNRWLGNSGNIFGQALAEKAGLVHGFLMPEDIPGLVHASNQQGLGHFKVKDVEKIPSREQYAVEKLFPAGGRHGDDATLSPFFGSWCQAQAVFSSPESLTAIYEGLNQGARSIEEDRRGQYHHSGFQKLGINGLHIVVYGTFSVFFTMVNLQAGRNPEIPDHDFFNGSPAGGRGGQDFIQKQIRVAFAAGTALDTQYVYGGPVGGENQIFPGVHQLCCSLVAVAGDTIITQSWGGWQAGSSSGAGHKRSFFPISLSSSKNNPRNIGNMPAVIFVALLDLGKKSSFVAGP